MGNFVPKTAYRSSPLWRKPRQRRLHAVPVVMLRADGQALIPVIFVMLILTVVGVSFGVSAHRNAQASGNYVNQLQRYYVALGAMNYAMSALAETSNNGSTYGIVPALPDTDSNGWAQVGDAWVKIDVIDTGAFLNLNSVTLANLQRMPVFRDNPDLANAVIAWRTSATATTGATGSTGGASGASSSSGTAAGDDPYQSLSQPYTLKAAPYDTVEELLLVQGMTPTLLYGNASGSPISASDTETDSANGVTTTTVNTGSGSTGSSSTGRAAARSRGAKVSRQGGLGTVTSAGGTGGTGGTGGAAGAGGTAAAAEDFSDIYTDSKVVLAQLFTTVSRERNVASDGNPRINVNTATAQDFQDQLGLTAAQANGLIRFRTPQTTGTGAQGGAGNTGAANRPPAAATPNLRSAYDPLDALDVTRQAAAGAGGTGTARPPTTGATGGTGGAGGGTGGGGAAQAQSFKTIADLLEVTTFTRTVMQRVADKLSVDDKVFHENLVNINTAPAEVLATVPGMTHNILNAILNYRQNGTYFQDLGDFFALQDLQRTDFQAVVASLTTKTSTYYVHIKVRTGEQQSAYAVSALVEMTDNGPHVLQWREVPRVPGWSTWLKPPTLPTPTLGQNSSGSSSSAQ